MKHFGLNNFRDVDNSLHRFFPDLVAWIILQRCYLVDQVVLADLKAKVSCESVEQLETCDALFFVIFEQLEHDGQNFVRPVLVHEYTVYHGHLLHCYRLELYSYIVLNEPVEEELVVERHDVVADPIVACTDVTLRQETDKFAQLAKELCDVDLVDALVCRSVLDYLF